MNETVLQFGAGNFLRGFVDLFIEQANRDPKTALGKVVVVQSTGHERARALNEAQDGYHVAIQGFRNGTVVNETEKVTALSRALYAGAQWNDVLTVARSSHLRWIVSNVTEAGFALDEKDRIRLPLPASYPAKLLAALLARYEAGQPGPTILPCELIEDNATKLRALVLEQAGHWKVDVKARYWIENECQWVVNLVDRIVPGKPKTHPLLESDPLLLSAEPFAFWAVQTDGSFLLKHPAITSAPDIRSYYLRKVRLLNGTHTALVAYALPKGLQTVRECVEHAEVGPWLEKLLFDEIVPVLEDRVENAAGFARDTLERFRNPFLDHKLEAIALNHEAKVRTRLHPTLEDYRARFGREPQLLSRLLSS